MNCVDGKLFVDPIDLNFENQKIESMIGPAGNMTAYLKTVLSGTNDTGLV